MGERRAGNNLLALGTAAVLAVYAAGYARTEAAAQRVAGSEGRKAAPPPAISELAPREDAPDQGGAVAPGEAGAAQQADAAAVEPGASMTAAGPDAPSAAGASAGSDALAASSGSASPSPDAKAASAAPTSVAASPSAAAAAAAPGAPTKVAAQPGKPAPAAPVKAETLPPAPAFPAADSAVAPPWNDGQFFGWGRSRHGDIRAGVEIADGRIVKAWIEGCYTRYSCSRIDNLIPQVAERQNPEVDNVSGATQSSDAFYYGVYEALGHAKQAK